MTQKIIFNHTEEIEPIFGEIRNLIALSIKNNPSITLRFLLIVGILNRTYELTESAIWAISNNRPQTSAFMMRGLYETLAFIYHAKKKISACSNQQEYDQILKQLLFGTKQEGKEPKAVNILTCINKASKYFIELEKNYNDISEMVHPNSASHLYTAKPTDDKEMLIELRIPFYEFKGIDKKAIINQTGECAFYIVAICKDLLNS